MMSLLPETRAPKTTVAFTSLYIPPWTRETVHPSSHKQTHSPHRSTVSSLHNQFPRRSTVPHQAHSATLSLPIANTASTLNEHTGRFAYFTLYAP